MGQSVWHKDDLGRLYVSTFALMLEANGEQSPEFIRGAAAALLAVAHAVGATVALPGATAVTVEVPTSKRRRLGSGGEVTP